MSASQLAEADIRHWRSYSLLRNLKFQSAPDIPLGMIAFLKDSWIEINII